MTRKQKKLKVGLSNLFSSPPPEQPAGTPSPVIEADTPAAQPAPAESVAPVTNANGVNEKISTPETQPETVSEKTGRSVDDSEFETDDTQLVVFKLGDEFYGLNIAIVESIIKAQQITLVPHAHEFVDGVTNLRGIIVPVVDLRTRLGMPRTEATRETRVIVVEHKSSVVGIVVDAVTEVLRMSSRIIEPPSQFVTGLDAAYISGIAKFPERLITLLDLGKVFVTAEAQEK